MRVDWPIAPLKSRRRFVPRFCPRRECAAHRLSSRNRLPYQSAGSYRGHLGRRVQRYLCLSCERTFSKQTFDCSYYLKRPELLAPVAAGLVAGSAHRQIARSLGCAPSTVTRLSARLGRHALLLQARALSRLPLLDETVVIDHFETFEFSQDLPFGVTTPVGSESWFVYGLEPAPHRRTGHCSPRQRARLLGRPWRDLRGGHRASFRRTLDFLLPLTPVGGPLRLITDGHPAYARELSRHRGKVVTRIHPNPPRGPKGSPRSLEAIFRDRAMFPNDLLHMLLRHSLAHHRRETIAFGRRINALMERLFLTVAWRNFVKLSSERRPEPVTPAMKRKLTETPWSWSRVLAIRLFPDRERVPDTWMQLYRREWTTPVLPTNTLHNLARAF